MMRARGEDTIGQPHDGTRKEAIIGQSHDGTKE